MVPYWTVDLVQASRHAVLVCAYVAFPAWQRLRDAILDLADVANTLRVVRNFFNVSKNFAQTLALDVFEFLKHIILCLARLLALYVPQVPGVIWGLLTVQLPGVVGTGCQRLGSGLQLLAERSWVFCTVTLPSAIGVCVSGAWHITVRCWEALVGFLARFPELCVEFLRTVPDLFARFGQAVLGAVVWLFQGLVRILSWAGEILTVPFR